MKNNKLEILIESFYKEMEIVKNNVMKNRELLESIICDIRVSNRKSEIREQCFKQYFNLTPKK